MNRLATALALPLAAGWGLHTLALRRRLEAAHRDPLTGLLTRAPFEERAARLLRAGPCAVVFVDLDGFKAVNDTHGHAAGDGILRATAGALHDAATDAPDAVLARLGGDEFAAVTPMASPVALPWLLRGLHDELTAPTWIEGRELTVGASVGGCWTGDLPDASLSAAVRRADEVMYLVKRGGGGWLPAAPGAPALPTANGRRYGRPGTIAEGSRG
ncbi:GGDEF domain-containing protein [Streptomyces reniochalinae]|uniref:GGDEF domain-containing protein n=1 Tax=Streptomyces reniochalinae TaxID=2250578 RepID=A0A367EAB6_9ACTN|nr:GGDEF domain-containing protein [Streptomyces reniochalinae]RCG14180.1 GGDEF domain-containing protein [Streptomyces reniochalinae]